ncbi:hypothetical protein GTY65_23805 [Streptomyces sp. SID8379]|uniref:hypothetical protein n=1 Tax=unclassified Streptomyces TaxID=2593676 RepID=UPI00036A3A17|nr:MULTISPECIES: hypothetical protein [unclassified Streptomyces]MYW67073.1 hypothetical protein [Streptomyces sp. SID8379]
MNPTVRRFGALVAITAAALVGLAMAESAGHDHTTNADSVWLAPSTPIDAAGDDSAAADEASDDAQPLAAPQDSVW